MIYKKAESSDFTTAFHFIETLWDYKTYNREEVQAVYEKIIRDENSFVYFLMEEQSYIGFCHGVVFDTFWMSGRTCYLSGLIVDSQYRSRGYGTRLLEYVKKLAYERECKCIVLDSALSRIDAHRFYESYGFEKGCYGFDLML